MFKKPFALFVVFVLAALPFWWLTAVAGTAVAAPGHHPLCRPRRRQRRQ